MHGNKGGSRGGKRDTQSYVHDKWLDMLRSGVFLPLAAIVVGISRQEDEDGLSWVEGLGVCVYAMGTAITHSFKPIQDTWRLLNKQAQLVENYLSLTTEFNELTEEFEKENMLFEIGNPESEYALMKAQISELLKCKPKRLSYTQLIIPGMTGVLTMGFAGFLLKTMPVYAAACLFSSAVNYFIGDTIYNGLLARMREIERQNRRMEDSTESMKRLIQKMKDVDSHDRRYGELIIRRERLRDQLRINEELLAKFSDANEAGRAIFDASRMDEDGEIARIIQESKEAQKETVREQEQQEIQKIRKHYEQLFDEATESEQESLRKKQQQAVDEATSDCTQKIANIDRSFNRGEFFPSLDDRSKIRQKQSEIVDELEREISHLNIQLMKGGDRSLGVMEPDDEDERKGEDYRLGIGGRK